MTDPGFAVQEAVYRRLSEKLSIPVYDAVPPQAKFPYLVIDTEITSNTSPVSGRDRSSRLLYLSVWSNYQGQAEVKKINSEVYAALNRQPLPLSAGRAISVTVENMRTNREPDGVTYQGAITVRILTQN